MLYSTLCYLEQGDQYLMLHRVKKAHDVNQGKWIGVGGKFLDGESPEDVDTVVEPDIAVICDPAKLDKYGCRGAPDMVVEILSPSTQRQDRFTKFSLYQRAGVREYWIVDPENKFVQSFWLEDGRYAVKEFGAAGDKMRVNVLEDCVIDLSEVFPEE